MHPSWSLASKSPPYASNSPASLALDGVSLVAQPGEVLAVVGENGAGKSTLMKIVAGVYQADAGEVPLDGGKSDSATPPTPSPRASV